MTSARQCLNRIFWPLDGRIAEPAERRRSHYLNGTIVAAGNVQNLKTPANGHSGGRCQRGPLRLTSQASVTWTVATPSIDRFV